MIKKVKGGYVAASSKGRPLSKKTQTKKQAIKQIVAVEYSKARAKGLKKPPPKAVKKALK